MFIRITINVDLTVAVEVDHGEDHERRVPAELQVWVALPRVAAPEV